MDLGEKALAADEDERVRDEDERVQRGHNEV